QGAKVKESAFGFYKGMTLKQAKVAAAVQGMADAPYTFTTTTPPRPVYPFFMYTIALTPSVGVCSVLAMTKPWQQGSNGLLENASLVLTMLKKRYGNPDPSNTPFTWTEPQG